MNVQVALAWMRGVGHSGFPEYTPDLSCLLQIHPRVQNVDCKRQQCSPKTTTPEQPSQLCGETAWCSLYLLLFSLTLLRPRHGQPHQEKIFGARWNKINCIVFSMQIHFLILQKDRFHDCLTVFALQVGLSTSLFKPSLYCWSLRIFLNGYILFL